MTTSTSTTNQVKETSTPVVLDLNSFNYTGKPFEMETGFLLNADRINLAAAASPMPEFVRSVMTKVVDTATIKKEDDTNETVWTALHARLVDPAVGFGDEVPKKFRVQVEKQDLSEWTEFLKKHGIFDLHNMSEAGMSPFYVQGKDGSVAFQLALPSYQTKQPMDDKVHTEIVQLDPEWKDKRVILHVTPKIWYFKSSTIKGVKQYYGVSLKAGGVVLE